MKKLLMMGLLLICCITADAQSVSFINLLDVYKGTLSPENAFTGGIRTDSLTQGGAISYVFEKGNPAEINVVVYSDQNDQREISLTSRDSVGIVHLQQQIVASGFVMDIEKELEGMTSYTYSNDSIAVWVNRANNGNHILKLYKKPSE